MFFNIDSTPDVSHTDQLAVIVHCVLDSSPVEWFLKFLLLTSHKGKDMADLVLEVLNKSNIDVINCRGQSYDNRGWQIIFGASMVPYINFPR